MPSFIRHPKDFWTGIIFIFFGGATLFIARDYVMGTAGKMGPAYFPSVLAGLLCLIGIAALIRSFISVGEPIEKFYLKELALVLGAVILFGVLIRGAGLVPATVVLILLSGYASPKFRWGSSLLIAAGLALFSVLLFVKLLNLPIPIFGPWLGN